MYAQHVPEILKYVQEKGPDGLVDVGSFCLCTIQTPISRVLEQMHDVKKHGVSSEALWGAKRGGYHHLRMYRTDLYHRLVEAPEGLLEATDRLLAVPGFGLPKASFMLQCLGYDTACLDVHNLKRYGISPNITKIGKVQPKTRLTKIHDYHKVLKDHTQGMVAEHYWDTWCSYVAGNRMNKKLPDAEAVSQVHVEAITC